MDVKWIRLGAILGFITSIFIILLSINFTPDFVARHLSRDNILHPSTINSISIFRLWLITISALGLIFTLLFLIKPHLLNSVINKLTSGEQEDARLYIILVLILTFLSLLPIWIVEFPPLQDYPFHLLEAHIFANYWNPNFSFQEIFHISYFPTPYILMYYMFLVLNHVFSIHVAGKIILSLYIILLPLSYFYLIHAINKEKIIFGFFSYLFMYNYFFNMGFINFSLSVPLLLFALGYWFKTKKYANWIHRTILSILILFVYMCHYFAFCVLFVMIIVLSSYFLRKPKKILANLVVFLPSLILLIISLSTDFTSSSTDYRSLSSDLAVAKSSNFILAGYDNIIDKMKFVFFYKKPASYYMSFDFILERILLVVILCLALFLVILQFRKIKKRMTKGRLLVALILFAIYFILPKHLLQPTLWIIDSRILVFLILIGILFLELPKNKLIRCIVLLMILSLTLAHLEVIFVHYRSVNRDLKEFYAAMNKIPSGKSVYFMTNEKISSRYRINPFIHFGAYYFLDKGEKNTADLTNYIGPLRPLKYKKKQIKPKLKGVDSKLKSARYQIRKFKPSYLLLFAIEKDGIIEKLIEGYGYSRKVKLDKLKIYKIERHKKQNIPNLKRRYYKFGNKQYDYLFVFTDADLSGEIKNDLELVFSDNYIRIFKPKRDL